MVVRARLDRNMGGHTPGPGVLPATLALCIIVIHLDVDKVVAVGSH